MTHVISRVECGCFSICDWHSKWERKGEGDANKKKLPSELWQLFFKGTFKKEFLAVPPFAHLGNRSNGNGCKERSFVFLSFSCVWATGGFSPPRYFLFPDFTWLEIQRSFPCTLKILKLKTCIISKLKEYSWLSNKPPKRYRICSRKTGVNFEIFRLLPFLPWRKSRRRKTLPSSFLHCKSFFIIRSSLGHCSRCCCCCVQAENVQLLPTPDSHTCVRRNKAGKDIVSSRR